jgi:chorismate mutase/prephenate dehydratase
VELRVQQYLMSRSGRIEDIERIYAHPQSFMQTSAWLRANLPKAEKIPVSSNAEARAARAMPTTRRPSAARAPATCTA